MKTCVSMWSLQREFFKGNIDTAAFIELASGWEVDGVELLDCFFRNDAEVLAVIELLDRKKMPVAAYSIANDFVTEDDGQLKSQVDYIKEGIDMAARLGTKTLRVFSGNVKDGIPYEKGLNCIIEGFKACAPHAEEIGVTMVLENHGAFAGTSSNVRSIIDAVGSSCLKANTDTGNFLLVLENPADAVENLKDVVDFVHFKDFRRLEEPNGRETYSAIDNNLYQGTPIGKGEVDLKRIIDILYESGYGGYLSVEYEGVGDSVEETRESVEFLKSVIK